MGYPPPPPPPGTPGQPGGYGPPTGPPPGYGAPPPGYGGPPPGGPPPSTGSGSSKGPLVALMAALVVVVLLVVVGGVILVSQGGDDEVELTEAQRTDALLTEGDIEGDFVETADDDEDDADDEPDASEACLDTLDELEAEGNSPFGDSDLPAGGAERHFEDEATGASIDHGIAPSIDVVSLYERFLADCDELTFTDDTGTATFTVEERDAPEVGDDAIALDIAVSAESDGQTFDIEGAVVAWTRDGNDSVISYLAGLDAETFDALPVDGGLLDDVVTTADDKLAEVIDEA